MYFAPSLSYYTQLWIVGHLLKSKIQITMAPSIIPAPHSDHKLTILVTMATMYHYSRQCVVVKLMESGMERNYYVSVRIILLNDHDVQVFGITEVTG